MKQKKKTKQNKPTISTDSLPPTKQSILGSAMYVRLSRFTLQSNDTQYITNADADHHKFSH